MKLAYISHKDISNIKSWSGTPYFISRYLREAGIEVYPIDKLKRIIPWQLQVARPLKNLFGNKQNLRFHPAVLANYTKQIMQGLEAVKPDAILVNDPILAADLDVSIPIYIWADTLYAGILAHYPPPSSLSQDYVLSATNATNMALRKSRKIILSSQWSANLATQIYGISADKVHVVPFGANVISTFSPDEMAAVIANRKMDTIKLLFMGRVWERKGGDIVFAVAKQLHASGRRVEVNFIGCQPPADVEIPDYIHCHGFVSKNTEAGKAQINSLLSESHFLFVPSRAEAFGIVFCEASAFGLPCLTSQIGGIPTIVKNNVNGMTFPLDASVTMYCDYITAMMDDRAAYERLAISSFNEYQQRLNWNTVIRQFTQLITT